MWYIWAAPNSPLFGKSKMSTFERYFIEDPSTHEEKKNAYYRLWENEEVVDNMLREFGLDRKKGISSMAMFRYTRVKEKVL